MKDTVKFKSIWIGPSPIERSDMVRGKVRNGVFIEMLLNLIKTNPGIYSWELSVATGRTTSDTQSTLARLKDQGRVLGERKPKKDPKAKGAKMQWTWRLPDGNALP